MAKKNKAKSIYDFKEKIIEDVEAEVEVVEEVEVSVQPTIKKPESFKSLKAAKAYAKANGGQVKEKGKFFYVR